MSIYYTKIYQVMYTCTDIQPQGSRRPLRFVWTMLLKACAESAAERRSKSGKHLAAQHWGLADVQGPGMTVQ